MGLSLVVAYLRNLLSLVSFGCKDSSAGVYWLSSTLQAQHELPIVHQLLIEVNDSMVADRHCGTRNGQEYATRSLALITFQNKNLRMLSIYYKIKASPGKTGCLLFLFFWSKL